MHRCIVCVKSLWMTVIKLSAFWQENHIFPTFKTTARVNLFTSVFIVFCFMTWPKWFTLKLLSCFRIPWTLWTPPLLVQGPQGIPCLHGKKRMMKAPLWEPSIFSPLFKVTRASG